METHDARQIALSSPHCAVGPPLTQEHAQWPVPGNSTLTWPDTIYLHTCMCVPRNIEPTLAKHYIHSAKDLPQNERKALCKTSRDQPCSNTCFLNRGRQMTFHPKDSHRSGTCGGPGTQEGPLGEQLSSTNTPKVLQQRSPFDL